MPNMLKITYVSNFILNPDFPTGINKQVFQKYPIAFVL